MLRLLQVEDDSVDIDLFKRALSKSGISVDLETAEDAEAALRFLEQRPDSSSPHLILLDLNLPKKNGHELLAELKRNSKLRVVPVIILTNSASTQDIAKCYEEGAACYLIKSPDFDVFTEQVKRMVAFWHMVALPNRREP